jgi:hypothetical protein
MKRISAKLTYANVMATVAVFLALGGGAYAATQLKKNSVGTKQIKNGAVTGAKIKNGTITGTNINLAKLGTVPSAAQANTAVTAANAANATTVNGHTAECKAGTQPFAGSCWESAPRPAATAATASVTCANLGGALPHALELAAFSQRATLGMTNEWTDDINTVIALNIYTVITVSKAGEIGETNAIDTKEYRCVLPLVR